MDKLSGVKQQAVLLNFMKQLKAAGSWCGETHIQKSVYFLSALMQVPFDYQFVLYKHGPYSFDLHDELVSMNAVELLKVEPQPPYGPCIVPTQRSEDLIRRFPKTIFELSKRVDFITQKLGQEGVLSLEQLATALMVTVEYDAPKDINQRALVLHELKPHISIEEARDAVLRVDILIKESQKFILS